MNEVSNTSAGSVAVDLDRCITSAGKSSRKPPYSVSGMVTSSSLISRPTAFRDPDFVINYWQNNENQTFPAAGIHVKCSCAPGCRDFYRAACNADAV